MKNETKNIFYMILDLLDTIYKTSQNNPNFIKLDKSKYFEVKDEIFTLLHDQDSRRPSIIDEKTELIGILPSFLVDRDKFPSNDDIVKLAEQSLNMQIPRWQKKSRDEIIGILISNINSKKDYELDFFRNAWKDFIRDDKSITVSRTKKDFVDTWLEFFKRYNLGLKNNV